MMPPQNVRYANCWEDARIVLDALKPAAGCRLLSVASGGDNALALLATGAHVVAADTNAAQLASLELKSAAFRRLRHGELLAFLGVHEVPNRLSTYAHLRQDLSRPARQFWDNNPEHVRLGVIHCGKFENFFRVFRRHVLPWIHSRETVRQLLDEKDPQARVRFYETRWNNWRWNLLFRLFFNRTVMGRLGRGREAFRHARGPVSAPLLARTRYALTTLPTHVNPFLEYITTGRFKRAFPLYLQHGSFEAIRSGLQRLTLFHGSIQEAATRHGAGGFDGYNLSDIFEYADTASFRDMGRTLLDCAKRGARLAYWNMLVPRKLADEFPERLRALDALSRQYSLEDRAFFYSAFILEEVRP